MSKFSYRLLVAGLMTVVALMGTSPVLAVQIYGGWTRADVGLQNDGDGFFVGVGNEIPMAGSVFDASYALEYVQKVGSQPTFFSDPETGFAVTDAEVTLHCVQPSLFLGARVPDIGIVPRIYVGTSIVLKVSEEWSDFPGQAHIEWGYKNTDIVGHVGMSLGVGPVTVDFRYTQGFIGQLLHDNTLVNTAKAETPPEGTHTPEIGAKLTNIQIGAGFTF
ncbi:MAG: hypothetical protein KAH56_04195 [Candidatus Krumholzibacteria bacterium]|nr:hypothetical protein [Candidatus Krumholzibacteria bacterium]